MDNISNDKISERQKELSLLIEQIVHDDGIQKTAIPTLQLSRISDVTDTMHFVYEPSLVFFIQGSKIVILGNEVYKCEPLSYLSASVHLPLSGRIIQATRTEPYLCVKLSFSPEQVIDIMNESRQEWRAEKGTLSED